MLDVSSPEALFGKDAVSDRKKLRRAYAKLIKRFRPETSPDEFAQIHDLYQAALKALKGAKKNRLADMAPPIDPEAAAERQQRNRLEDLPPPPKWSDAKPEREREPEPKRRARPEWQRPDVDRPPERERPEWEQADAEPERQRERPDWKRADPDAEPERQREKPDWKQADPDAEPERQRKQPDWKRADPDAEPERERKQPDWKQADPDAEPERQRAKGDWKQVDPDAEPEREREQPDWNRIDPDAEPEAEAPPEPDTSGPEWQQVDPNRRPIAPETLEAEAEAAAALMAAIDDAWAHIRTDPDAAIERFRQLAEHAPHAPVVWYAWASAVHIRDQAPPREPLRAAMRSPARDQVVAFLIDLADQSPDGFFEWMDAEIIQSASRAAGFHDLVESWWMMTVAYGKPKAIQAAARAIVDLPVRFDEDFMADVLCDAAENALWAGRRPWLERWRREIADFRSTDNATTRRLDDISWLTDHADEVDELLLHDDLQPVVEFLRDSWDAKHDDHLRAHWQRHLVGLREFGDDLEQVAVDVNALAPGLCEIYRDLLSRVPMHLSDHDYEHIRGWLQRQEQVVDQHPLRIWYHVKLWPVYLAVLAAGLVLPPFLFLAVPVYRIAEGKLRYKIYNDYVRQAFAHLCRTNGYARREVLHVLEDARLPNLQDMRHTLEEDISIDIEGASMTRTR